VDSVLNQTFQSFELIIVDDFSEDNTSDYLKGLSHPRVKYFTNSSPMGACYSRNLAIKNALGKYVTGLDDDYYLYN
jgi:glycosyltransferase involved in cell wall biosynthesis